MSMTDLLYPSSYVRAENNKVRSWFEFLLDADLLEKHLSQDDPDPSGCLLIKQFFDQANRPVNDQGQILPPPDNERNQAVKSLALQTASLLKWDLNIIDKELPITARHQLLTEFMKACKTAIPPAPQNALAGAIETMHDHALTALILFSRWGGRTIVKSTFPVKPGGRITPTVPQSVPYQANAQQRCDEVREQILSILKEQMFDIVQFLEAVLHHIKREVRMPGQKTIADNDLCSTTENPSDIVVTCEELHAQICYDLGCLHFTHCFYGKASQMFGHVREWIRRLPASHSGFCDIDEKKLNGYRAACQMISQTDSLTDDALGDLDNLHLKVDDCLKQKKSSAIREMTEYIIEDVYRKELSTSYLDQVNRSIQNNSEGLYGDDMLFEVNWSVAVRRAVRGADQPVNLWTSSMNVAQLQRIIGMVQQVAPYINQDESERLGGFLCSLANNLPDTSLTEQLLQFEVTKKLVPEDELNALLLRTKSNADSPQVPRVVSSKPEPSSSTSSSQTLERTLLRSCDPIEIQNTLKELHSAAGGTKKYCNLSARWELPPTYVSSISASTSDAEAYDRVHLLLAKSHHYLDDCDYSNAKKLLFHLQKTCTSKSEQKILKVANNELLKVELVELLNDKSLNYADREECTELRNQLSDVVTRCRQLLTSASSPDQSKQSNLPPNLVELCAAMLLNLEDNSYFASVGRALSVPPCVRVASLLAAVRSALVERSTEPRKAAHDLWAAAMAVYATAAPLAGSTGGRGGSKKAQLEPLRNLAPSNAIIGRPAFVEFVRLLRNPHLLQLVLSLLVHLHRLCRTDILTDVTIADAHVINTLWPGGLDGAPLSGPCVTLALREVLTYCLTLQPQNRNWLRTQADLHHAFSNYGSALRCYLLLGAYSTNYFSDIPAAGPYDDEQVIQRMIKCCMHMKCFTQAAVLCQMTKEVDYQTAFKALQENRERTDAAEAHYHQHIWDVQILEHAAYEHRESGEGARKAVAVTAISRPELNRSNSPAVGARVKSLRQSRFFQSMSRQYLCA